MNEGRIAMSFERALTFRVNDKEEIRLRISYNEQDSILTADARGPGGDDHAEAYWKFDWESWNSCSLQFNQVAAIGPQAVCILHCIGIIIGKTLLECLLGSGSRDEIEKCLKGKAISALADAVECIAKCLGVV
jgi:hypothetical protein